MTRFRLLLLSLMAVGLVAAVASASASALVWEICSKNPGGVGPKYPSQSQCEKLENQGSGEWEWLNLPVGQSLKIETTGNTQTFRSTKLNLEIKCTGVKTTGGTIENSEPTPGETIGLDSATAIEYTGCTVPKPSGCEVKTAGLEHGNITVGAVKTELALVAGIEVDKFKPNSGTTFVAIELGKTENTMTKKFTVQCGTLGLSAKNIEGEAYGRTEEMGKLTFANEGTLKIIGEPAEYGGVTESKMEGGGIFRAS